MKPRKGKFRQSSRCRCPAACRWATSTKTMLLAFAACLTQSPTLLAQQLHLADAISRSKLHSLSEAGWNFDGLGTVSANRLVRWGAWPGILKQQATWLADGSWLVGEFQIEGARLSIDSDWLRVPTMDLSSIRGVVVSPPASPSKWNDLQRRMAAAEGGQDIVWLSDQQRVSGVIRWPPANEGQWHDRLILENGDLQTEIPLEDVQAIVFSPALLGPLPDPVGPTLGLSDGTLLRGCEFDFTGGHVTLRLAAGIELESLDKVEGFTSAVCYVAGKPESAQFLSAMKPASYRNLSENKLTWELGIDRDVYGKALLLRQGFVAKGVSLHSSSQVAYRWDGSSARFLAEVVLAPAHPMALASVGSVRCQVLLARDGKLQLEKEFALRRENPSSDDGERVEVDLDMSGAQLIVLVVEKSDFGQYGDQVFWLDARIAKPLDELQVAPTRE